MVQSSFVRAVDEQSLANPDRTAFVNSRGDSLTYRGLRDLSDRMAVWIARESGVEPGAPIIVYGHKSPLMLACFFACAKSGHAYAPVDTVYPVERIANIAEQLGRTALIDFAGADSRLVGAALPCPRIDGDGVVGGLAAGRGDAATPIGLEGLQGLGPDDTFYILFTSGSTGTPKGVEVPTSCVDSFYAWISGALAQPGGQPRVWFNRTPFSFDVSLTDMACGLTRGDTSFALEEDADNSFSKAFAALAGSHATDWVSTPSFVDQCLADPSFNRDLMPDLRRMLVAGETLRPATVRRVKERFPGIRFFNGYGPTESTDLVTLCEITDEMLAADKALPIGYAKTGTDFFVLDPVTLQPVPQGAPGELFLAGDTVAKGYWRLPAQTEAAFRSCPADLAAGRRSYRTGDEVTIEPDGMVYFHGRLDLQIKLHGFRIELGDIESVLCSLPDVGMACVLPVVRDGAISHLTAFVVPADREGARGFELTRSIKRQARSTLPQYMIPSSFKYLDEMPLNPSGKADRKALAAMLGA